MTTRRLVYARERLLRSPLILSFDIDSIDSATASFEPLYGRVEIGFSDGRSRTFSLIKPRERANELAEAIGIAAEAAMLADPDT